MAKNILVINVDIRETRVALIENGIIAELHLERQSAKGTLGNVYLGKVSRVLQGMQAAFIDIGQERAAFLHVEDLIRPDDFEAYLAGKRTTSVDDESTHVHAAEPEPDRAEPPPKPEPGPQRDTPQRDAPRNEERGHGRRGRRDDRSRAEGASPRHAETDLGLPGYSAAASPEASPHAGAPDAAASPVAPPPSDVGQSALGAAAPGAESPDAAPPDDEDEPFTLSDQSESDASDAEESDDDDANDGDAVDDDVEASADDDDDEEPSEDDDEDEDDESAEDESAEAEPSDDEADSDDDEPAEDAGDEAGAEEGDEKSDDEAEPGEIAAEGASVGADGAAGATGDAVATTQAEEDAATKAPRSRSRRGSRGRRRSGSTAERRKTMEAAAPVAPAVEAPAARERRAGGGDQRGQRRGQGKRDGRPPRGGSGGKDDRGRGDRGRSSKADPLRISKSTPIKDVVREGQQVIVQVSKEPIGTKGARVTSHISLPGRYVVYLPTVEHVGISKRIGSDKERGRLREAIDAMKPPSGGLIVRTLAEGLTKKSLKADVGYLVRLWGEIARKREQAPRAPECLYAELDLVLKVARDLLNDDIEEVVIDNREEYIRLRRFIEMFMPERVESLKLYEGQEPIFDAYGIEEEIGRALSRKVPLNSGGHLIIDQAEALTAIDVNTGRFVGKGSKDLEDTILITNLEAVEEIAYQLRFRNIGGLIILDLIDMDRTANREKVRRRLEQLLAKDKAKTTVNRISELGLIEMTRKRTRESLGRLMNEPCFYCDGTGNLQSKQTVAYEILRQIKRERSTLRGYSVTVNAHPAIVDLMKNEERTAVQEAERRYQRRIDLVPRKEYHLEQFDLIGK